MRWRPAALAPASLGRRLILGLVALQGLLLLLAMLSEPVFGGRNSLRQWLAVDHARQLLAASLQRDGQGELVLRPTPALSAYMAAVPEFWVIATDGDRLLRAGQPNPRPKPLIDLPERVVPGPLTNQGTPVVLHSAAGWVGVMLGNPRSDLGRDLSSWLGSRLRRWLVALAVLTAVTTAAIVGLVQFLLRPVRAAAQAAKALQPGHAGPALPETGVPAEILPLVSATNAAFARLERAHERQRRFIANAAHELRTPIAILGLRLDALPPGPTRLRLQQDLHRLTLLANQLLDLERLQQASPPRDAVELVALARDVVAEMAPLALDGGHSLEFASAVLRLDLTGDEQALRGVLLNLIGNALTHGGAGTVVLVRIGADRSLEVADSGPGIPPEARERVFEAFQRAGRSGSGAGLGLHIVREVLQAHGAAIALREMAPGNARDGSAADAGGRPGACFRIAF